jgi:hypothetical protein
MSNQGQSHLNFIEKILPKLIVKSNEDLKNHKIVNCKAESSTTLDGFMSAIFTMSLLLEDEDGK